MNKIIFHASTYRMAIKTGKICKDPNVTVENIDKYVIDNNIVDMVDFSFELYYTIKEFMVNEWDCYITSLDNINIDTMYFNNVYNISTDTESNLNKNYLNENIDIIFVKIVGSVLEQVDILNKYLVSLNSHYKGLILNNPNAMIKGMNKRYLIDLLKLGKNVIDTFYYSKDVSMVEINEKFPSKENYIIKPINGELSTNLLQLSDLSEEFLREVEFQVEGWIIQPYIKEIWNGEYQIFFIGEECIRSAKKEYLFNHSFEKNKLPNQINRKILEYSATDEEIQIALDFKKTFEEIYNAKLYIWRFDFIKTSDSNAILLELETVNPGLFIKYLDIEKRKFIMKKIYNHISSLLKFQK